ncbi:hypothetical protein [Ramlibacter sp.]|uniref:hypothetical protein n=1 Tax=Ramlibacter sp. TaxID=1917967 RepID=UPI0017E5C5B3|nr:hypothetical protein [Ramlibacter sp.]MBA2675562.1 hypothetical protein [Ramlibacter sp.]
MSEEELDAFAPPLIHIHVKFADGSLDGPFLVDLMNMGDDEDDALAAWLSDLSQGNTHQGRNKPSWLLNQDGSPRAGTYHSNKIWHYHCGPAFKANAAATLTAADLPHNENGLTSGTCIHYSKLATPMLAERRDLTVLGYSREHAPFLRDDDRSNPLRSRAAKVGDSVPATSVGLGPAE